MLLLTLYFLVPLAGRSNLLLLLLPLLVAFGVFLGIYLTRRRSKQQSPGSD